MKSGGMESVSCQGSSRARAWGGKELVCIWINEGRPALVCLTEGLFRYPCNWSIYLKSLFKVMNILWFLGLHIKNARTASENQGVEGKFEGVSGWYLPWAEGCSIACKFCWCTGWCRKAWGMTKYQLPTHTAKDSEGLDGTKWASGSDLVPLNLRHILRTQWTLLKIDMIPVCLDSSVQQVVSIPKSVTWKTTTTTTKINLSPSVPKRISRERPMEILHFTLNVQVFFPLKFSYILFSTSFWMPFDFYLWDKWIMQLRLASTSRNNWPFVCLFVCF